MKKYLSLVLPLLITACATNQQHSLIGVPEKGDLSSNVLNNGLPLQERPFSEIQCFGDLIATYNEWDTEPGPLNDKFNLTFLPVTNQTTEKNYIPTDVGLMAQHIANNLGINYNIIFTPSITDTTLAPNVYKPLQDSLISRINNNSQLVLGSNKTNIPYRNITIISAITDYEVHKRNSPSGNILGNGTTDNNSFSAGLSSSKSNYAGRISMVFNTAYFARTGDYTSPQLIYNPNTSTKVTINFEDTINNSELSFSYNGNKPALGYKIQKSADDSRYLALSLLIERGLLQVLGKYHRVPYWRCLEQNQKPRDFTFVDKNGSKTKYKNIVLGKQLLTLDKARQVPGYDYDVEAMVRRMFRYKGNSNGLGNYTYREENISNEQEILYVTVASSRTQTPWIAIDNETTYPLVAPKGTYQKYNLMQCAYNPIVKQVKANISNLRSMKILVEEQSSNFSLADKIQFIQSSNAAEAEYNSALNNCKKQIFEKFNLEQNDLLKNNGFNEKVIIGGMGTLTQNIMYTSLIDLLQQTYQTHPSLSVQSQELAEFIIENQESSTPLSDKFVSLWMSAPYLKDARIYPYYIKRKPKVPYIPPVGEIGR